jgi:hypothetical protein
MINLCNDVLNKSRRNMFQKLPTLSNKLSLNSLILLRKQNPYKFYKSFYDKILKKQNEYPKIWGKKIMQNNSKISLLSKTQNNFYSVPIKYSSSLEKMNFYHCNNHNDNTFNSLIKDKRNKNNISAINILDNKNLIQVHEYLLKNNKKGISLKKKIKNNSSYNKKLIDNNRGDCELENSLMNEKVSRGQQTINNFSESRKNEELDSFNNNIEFENSKNKIFNNGGKSTKKFIVEFNKQRQKIHYKRNYNINIIWKNLRRPINMDFYSFSKVDLK